MDLIITNANKAGNVTLSNLHNRRHVEKSDDCSLATLKFTNVTANTVSKSTICFIAVTSDFVTHANLTRTFKQRQNCANGFIYLLFRIAKKKMSITNNMKKDDNMIKDSEGKYFILYFYMMGININCSCIVTLSNLRLTCTSFLR